MDGSLAGRLVDVRGERWLVTSVEPFDRCAIVRLEGRDKGNRGERAAVVTPFDRVDPVSARRLARRSRARTVRVALGALAGQRPAGGLWTAAGAAMDLLPFQIEPAMAVLAGVTRVLLADEVGLGKTVQAGLVLAELLARGWAERALVLVPPGLREPWALELSARFGLDAAIVDFAWLAERARRMPPLANPWSVPRIAIASVDFAKRGDTLPAIARVPFDVVIADEAHHLTPGSDRGAAVARLGARAPWVLLLTATPHSGDETAFHFLRGLGRQGDGLALFRRTRSDAGVTSRRRTRLLAVRLSPAERVLARATSRYARSVWRQRGRTDPAARLVAITIARRAASSAAALHATLARRLALLSSGEAPAAQLPLPWDDSVGDESQEDAGCLGAQGWHDAAGERRRLQALLALAGRARTGASKIRCVDRYIARAGEPVVVFTEFRDTLDAVVERLGPRHRVAALHGGLLPAARADVLDRFASGGADVLVATDAAGEGLNLHHRCRVVVTMELPWNPVRLEQRVGRVDRIGQSKAVRALHLYHRGTVEDTVLARLERRRARAGQAMATEARVADAMFTGAPLELPADPMPASDRMPSAPDEARRIARLRAWMRLARGGAATTVWAAPRPGATSGQHLVLLHEAQLTDEAGRLAELSHIAVVVALHRSPANRREARQLIGHLQDDDRVAALIHAWCADRVDEVHRLHRELMGRPVERVKRIRLMVAAEVPRLVQGSLFDRRAAFDFQGALGDARRLEAQLLRGPSPVTPGSARWHVRLVAALPFGC